MKAFLFACIAIAVIAVGASYTLDTIGWSSAERAAAPSVRLD